MSEIYTVIIGILGILAVSGLFVGVTNDAVNFLNSAIGSKAASMRVILTVASVGIVIGVITSSGMMEVARSGMFNPALFSFHEVMMLYLGVMFANVILLDLYNSWGLPTSTTVSLIFCLLGAAIAVSVYKIAGDPAQGVSSLGQYINTSRAMGIVSAILLSVVIAFTCGTVVMYISRLIFSFRYTVYLRRYGAVWCGASLTAIVYFAVFKGLKSILAGHEFIRMIDENLLASLFFCWVGCSLLLFIIQRFRINILRITILSGTFALALAFAGNDLVNFIGVPLAGYDSYLDYAAHGAGSDTYLMSSLNEPARTPFLFLAAAGVIMVWTLCTSKKAQKVIKTSVDLSRQDEGEEMFGSSAVARSIVRTSMSLAQTLSNITPPRMRAWINARFSQDEAVLADGAAFDLVRASVNLLLASLLIALGTSLKLPLSTTYVTFMVAMGTSLADRAWGRESAVFRITGVLSVIGGWFITAGVAFTACFFVALAMYYGGTVVMVALILLAAALLVHSNIRYRRKLRSEHEDDLFKRILVEKDKTEVWNLLRRHVSGTLSDMLDYTAGNYRAVTDGFVGEDRRALRRVAQQVDRKKEMLRKVRRREMIGMRRINRNTAIEKNMWFHLGSNCCIQFHYALKRMNDLCREHVDNNFNPLPAACAGEFLPVRDRVVALLERAGHAVRAGEYGAMDDLLAESEAVRARLVELQRIQMDRIQEENSSINVSLVYLNLLQESLEIISSLRHLLRASRNFQQ